MPSNNKLLGHIACPCCANESAEVKESKKGKPYVMCECGYQGFARGAEAIKGINGKMRPLAEVIADKVAEVKAETPEAKPAPTARVTKHTADGDTTIFDVLFNLGKKQNDATDSKPE